MGILAGKVVGSEDQPTRELVALIIVEHCVRSYGSKPLATSVAYNNMIKEKLL